MEAIFDHSAVNYDRLFTHSNIGRLQRDRVWKYLRSHLPVGHGLNILETNCGTGEDAIFLAEMGHLVTATDLSPEMIRTAEAKSRKRKLEGSIDFNAMAIEDLSVKLNHRQFDVILSNFGGLNCIPPAELKAFLNDLPSLLTPGGRFFGVIMPRFCFLESCYFLVKGKAKKAFRRYTKHAVQANVEGHTQSTWYYGPSFVKKNLPDELIVKAIRPIGIFLPPSYLESFVQPKKILLRTMSKMENTFGNLGFLGSCADHYLIDIQKSL